MSWDLENFTVTFLQQLFQAKSFKAFVKVLAGALDRGKIGTFYEAKKSFKKSRIMKVVSGEKRKEAPGNFFVE